MGGTDVAYRSAVDLAGDIARRELLPVEVMEETLRRVEEREPSLNAIVCKGFDEALDAAHAAEEALGRGEQAGGLTGVPVVMKDLFDFKPGWPATFGGIPAMADFSIDAYCVWAERMERAGAIIIGKGNSPALGFRGCCDNYLFGPSRNPFDTSRNTGGSSGGSAAVVADGLVPIAEGTDGGGSIRIPAAWCGVVGYQPSAGRVPVVLRPDAFSGVSPFIYEGPITRNVADAALAMSALAGPHPDDPFSALDSLDFSASLDRGVEGWTIAYSPDLGVYPVQSEVAAVVEEAVHAFEEAGARVVEVDVEIDLDQRELADLWCRLIMPLSLDAFSNLAQGGLDILGEHRDDLPPEFPALGRPCGRDVGHGVLRRQLETDSGVRCAAEGDVRPRRAGVSNTGMHAHREPHHGRDPRTDRHRGDRGGSRHRMVHDLLHQLHRVPRGFRAGGAVRWPPRRVAGDRQTCGRSRCAHSRRGLRAGSTLEPHLRDPSQQIVGLTGDQSVVIRV